MGFVFLYYIGGFGFTFDGRFLLSGRFWLVGYLGMVLKGTPSFLFF